MNWVDVANAGIRKTVNASRTGMRKETLRTGFVWQVNIRLMRILVIEFAFNKISLGILTCLFLMSQASNVP
jgi:hypothetical protein